MIIYQHWRSNYKTMFKATRFNINCCITKFKTVYTMISIYYNIYTKNSHISTISRQGMNLLSLSAMKPFHIGNRYIFSEYKNNMGASPSDWIGFVRSKTKLVHNIKCMFLDCL